MPKINREIAQGTDAWFAAKLGKPSASNASKLITSKGEPSKSMKGYAKDLAYELFTEKRASDWGGNDSTNYGTIMEPESAADYELLTGNNIEHVAFITDDHERYLCSPDGLVLEQKRGVELKNKPKLHIDTLLYYKKFNKPPTDYITQVQMSMFVAKYEAWDLYYYNPILPCLLIEFEPDLKMHRALEMQLAEVIHERDKIVKILEEF